MVEHIDFCLHVLGTATASQYIIISRFLLRRESRERFEEIVASFHLFFGSHCFRLLQSIVLIFCDVN